MVSRAKLVCQRGLSTVLGPLSGRATDTVAGIPCRLLSVTMQRLRVRQIVEIRANSYSRAGRTVRSAEASRYGTVGASGIDLDCLDSFRAASSRSGR